MSRKEFFINDLAYSMTDGWLKLDFVKEILARQSEYAVWTVRFLNLEKFATE
jgi:hypothetical protein